MYEDQTPPQNTEYTMMESSYIKEQHQEILLGKEEGLDVSLYANPEFNWLQMEQIRLALEDGLPIDTWLTDDMYA